MGLIDPTHLVIVAIVALVVIGPRRLPEVARAMGRAVHEFRSALDEGSHGSGPAASAESPGVGPEPGLGVGPRLDLGVSAAEADPDPLL